MQAGIFALGATSAALAFITWASPWRITQATVALAALIGTWAGAIYLARIQGRIESMQLNGKQAVELAADAGVTALVALGAQAAGDAFVSPLVPNDWSTIDAAVPWLCAACGGFFAWKQARATTFFR